MINHFKKRIKKHIDLVNKKWIFTNEQKSLIYDLIKYVNGDSSK